MKLQPKEKNGDRDYIMSRGGFTAVARHAKSNIITVFKDNLLKFQGWCIASSLPSTRATKKPEKLYTILDLPILEGKKTYYLVTPIIAINDNDAIPPRFKANIDLSLDVDCVVLLNCCIHQSIHEDTSHTCVAAARSCADR